MGVFVGESRDICATVRIATVVDLSDGETIMEVLGGNW